MNIFNARFLNNFLDECNGVLSTKLLTAELSDIEIQKKLEKISMELENIEEKRKQVVWLF